MKILKFAFIFIFFIFLHADENALKNISQTLSDTPQDRPLEVEFNDHTYCYNPTFTKGESYVYLDDCKNVKTKARYDVFGRISFNVRGSNLCLSAPSSITGIGGKSTQKWDYLTLRPCVLNDENQRFKIHDRRIFTAKNSYRVKNHNWYAYISKNPNDKHNHLLSHSMDEWANLRATPANLSFKTPVTWLFATPSFWGIYYLQNNQSALDSITELYYNPENGHLAQYYKQSGDMYCMTTQHKNGQAWNWVRWEKCREIPQDPLKDKRHFWELFLQSDSGAMLKDSQGNFLRVSAYGPNWGVPYTASAEFLSKDKKSSPKDYFLLSHDLSDFSRFTYANLAQELPTCPAKGVKEEPNIRVKRDLHENFSLHDERWIRRLWQIARSGANDESEGIGLCGTCLLQSMQMVLEMLNDPEPRNDGEGYLFNTAHLINPFISFQARYPGLASVLSVQGDYEANAARSWEDMQSAIGHSALGMTSSFLSNYILSGTNMMNAEQLNGGIEQVLSSPENSIWINFIYTTNADGSDDLAGHIQPLVRTNQGLVYITTNYPDISFDLFRARLQVGLNSVHEVRNYLERNGELRVVYSQFIRVQRRYFNPLVLTFSQNNCTGEGEGRRGNKRKISKDNTNQCESASKRCGIGE